MFKCECCGKMVKGTENRVYDVKQEERISVCSECATYSGKIFYCVIHDRFEYGTHFEQYEVENYGMICKNAYHNNTDEFNWCEECDRLFHVDDLLFDDYGNLLCHECIGDLDEYHSHDFNEFLTTKNETTNQFYGIELEVECHISPRDVVEEIKPIIEKEFVVEKDGSLDNGFEMISKPFSYNYMIENLENTLEEVYGELAYYENTEIYTNGMHIHLTKQSHMHEFNMVCLVEYYQNELTILSNRRTRDLKRWAKFLIEKDDLDMISERMISNEIDCDYRYFACNLCNENTIEIRIFKATNDVKEILGRIELIHNMSEYAKENSINDFKDMPSFIEIATYKENRYVNYILEKYNLINVATC